MLRTPSRGIIRVMTRTPAMAPNVFRPTFTRFASSSSEDDLPDKDILKLQDVVSKLNQHPEIRELLAELQTILVNKGFNPEVQPSFTEIMKLFADKEVRELAKRLKGSLDKAGIEISPEDMGLFMKLLK